MFESKATKSGEFRAAVRTYGQLEQEVQSLRDEAAFYKQELEDALRLVERLKVRHEQS